jgi:alkylhydroperoxidase/carboxymuconolactone decarboxylase family protein YurZ
VGNGASIVKVRPSGFDFFEGGNAVGRFRLIVDGKPYKLQAAKGITSLRDRHEMEQNMARKNQPNAPSDAAHVKLPGAALHMARAHPALWEAFQHLGEEASRAGPLDARTRRLIHLALAIAASSEGATHSHARRASSEGISPEELEHVATLAITAVGWSQAIKGLTWVRDITHARPGATASEPLEP